MDASRRDFLKTTAVAGGAMAAGLAGPGKAAGTYRYQTEQCVTVFSSTSCWEAAGPVSVTVRATPTPMETLAFVALRSRKR